eukprot:gene3233-6398_t
MSASTELWNTDDIGDNYSHNISSHDHIQFVGLNFTSASWKQVKEQIHCALANGDWIENMPHLPFHREKSLCHIDYKKDSGCLNVTQGAGIHYSWKVKHGQCLSNHIIAPFSSETMCRLLRDEHVLLVGDSLTEQFAFTLFGLIYDGHQCNNCDDRCNLDHAKIPCKLYNQNNNNNEIISFEIDISMRRNDRLHLNKDVCIEKELNFHDYPWIHLLSERNISLLILNRGAHYENNSKVLQDLEETISFVRSNFPHISIIFRDTPRGHLNWECSFFSAPLPKNRVVPRRLPYNW